jgi:hypothetical protein
VPISKVYAQKPRGSNEKPIQGEGKRERRKIYQKRVEEQKASLDVALKPSNVPIFHTIHRKRIDNHHRYHPHDRTTRTHLEQTFFHAPTMAATAGITGPDTAAAAVNQLYAAILPDSASSAHAAPPRTLENELKRVKNLLRNRYSEWRNS